MFKSHKTDPRNLTAFFDDQCVISFTILKDTALRAENWGQDKTMKVWEIPSALVLAASQ